MFVKITNVMTVIKMVIVRRMDFYVKLILKNV